MVLWVQYNKSMGTVATAVRGTVLYYRWRACRTYLP